MTQPLRALTALQEDAGSSLSSDITPRCDTLTQTHAGKTPMNIK